MVLTPPEHVEVDDPLDLARLYEEALGLVVLRWPISAETSAEAEALVSQQTTHLLRVEATRDALAAQLDRRVPPALAREIAEIAFLFACLLDAPEVGIRLASFDRPPCPRFHVDRVVARGVLTFAGAGTEWVSSQHVDRSRLGHGSQGLPDESSGLLRPGHVLRSIPASSFAIFKGDAWPGFEGRGVVHRSPPRGERLLLTLDALD